MFDLTNAKSNNFDTLPDGKYTANVTDAKMKDTKSGGMMIVIALTVTDGEMKGRKVFHNFNVENSNPKAVEIGLGQLKSLLENSGYKDPNHLGGVEELCGLTVGVKTKTRKDEGYGEKAQVSYFFKPEAATTEEPLGF